MSKANRQERIERSQALWASVEWDDVATFIGPNAKRFHGAWEKTHEQFMAKGYGIGRSFCWGVLFFSFAWFLGRKQWAMGAALLVLPVLMGMIFKLSAGGTAGITIVFAIYAKSFYLQTAIPKIAHIVAQYGPGAARDQALRAAGGLSIPGLVIGGLLVAFVYFAVAVAIVGPR